MPSEQRVTLEIDLSEIITEQALISALAAVLGLKGKAVVGWEEFNQALHKTRLRPTRLILRALRELERKLPEGARAMLKSIAGYNNLVPDIPLAVEAGEDYVASIYFVQYLATRNESNGDRKERAYASCWIKHPAPDGALAVAKDLIEDAGWQIVSLMTCNSVTFDDYDDAAEDGEFFRQSLIDGKVCVFDSWIEE